MKRKRIMVGLAAALVVLAAAVTAQAAPNGKVPYRFVGTLQSAPNGSALTVEVQSGNRRALRALLGQSQVQTFTAGADTVFLRWSHGVPAVATIGDLAQGDRLAITIRAPRGASLAEVLATAPATIGDHGTTWKRPTQPLYLFRGTLVSATTGSVTVDVAGGNHRALRLMVGQGNRQTFATGEGTIFLHWQGRIPTVTSSSNLQVGARVVVRVRADGGSTLAQVEGTAARRVAEHEPASQEAAQNASS